MCAFAVAVVVLVASPQPPANAASAKDRDRDGLSDRYEVRRSRTNPRKKDTDRDGLSDRYEIKRSHTNPRKKDTDRDGLSDGKEFRSYKTSPRRKDTDRDGLSDGKEVRDTRTNPRKRDTDGDGVSDRSEVRRGTNPRWPETKTTGPGAPAGGAGPTSPLPAPAVTPPAPRAPVVTTPVVKTPVVTAPVVTAPVVTAPVVTAPVVTTPLVQPPSSRPPAPQPAQPPQGGTVPATSAPVFSDEFAYSGAPDPAKWSLYKAAGYQGGLRCPEAFNVANGMLTVTAKMVRQRVCGQPDPTAPPTLVAGGMSARSSFTYGRVVARVRVDPDPTGSTSGVLIAWPDANCWTGQTHACGEMDFYETGDDPTRNPVKAFMHYGADRGQDLWRRFSLGTDGTQWHEVVMDWRPTNSGTLNLYVDGQRVAGGQDDASNWLTDVSKHLTVQLDSYPPAAVAAPVRMQVDYIRVYR